MHWLEKFRREYCRKDGTAGIDREELAKLVQNRDTGCSAALIAILEEGGITHPAIAQRIAKVTKCTQAQYNSMIHKMHWGKWTPAQPKKRSEMQAEKRPQPLSVGVIPENARWIVQLDRSGAEINRFRSVMRAAQALGCSDSVVFRRCAHRTRPGSDEFAFMGCTFRYADVWDSMTAQQRQADLHMPA